MLLKNKTTFLKFKKRRFFFLKNVMQYIFLLYYFKGISSCLQCEGTLTSLLSYDLRLIDLSVCYFFTRFVLYRTDCICKSTATHAPANCPCVWRKIQKNNKRRICDWELTFHLNYALWSHFDKVALLYKSDQLCSCSLLCLRWRVLKTLVAWQRAISSVFYSVALFILETIELLSTWSSLSPKIIWPHKFKAIQEFSLNFYKTS